MAKRNQLSGDSELGVKDEVIPAEEALGDSQQDQSPSYVPLRLRINARYVTYGSVTGTKYIFDGAGSVVSVLADDAPELLAKIRKQTCCVGTTQQNIFEVGE